MNKCIDYAYKQYVLINCTELLKWQKRSKLYQYSMSLYQNEGIISYALKTNKEFYTPYSEIQEYCKTHNLLSELRECERLNHAEFERTKRLKKRIESMISNGSCLFLTLTFTDKTLKDTNAKQRRIAVSRFLKQFGCRYIANIDFGADKTKTMREHYHAIIQCDNIDLNGWRKYGNINVQRIRNKNIDDDKVKLAKYVSKLSNHAIKENARRSSLMYSR